MGSEKGDVAPTAEPENWRGQVPQRSPALQPAPGNFQASSSSRPSTVLDLVLNLLGLSLISVKEERLKALTHGVGNSCHTADCAGGAGVAAAGAKLSAAPALPAPCPDALQVAPFKGCPGR